MFRERANTGRCSILVRFGSAAHRIKDNDSHANPRLLAQIHALDQCVKNTFMRTRFRSRPKEVWSKKYKCVVNEKAVNVVIRSLLIMCKYSSLNHYIFLDVWLFFWRWNRSSRQKTWNPNFAMRITFHTFVDRRRFSCWNFDRLLLFMD